METSFSKSMTKKLFKIPIYREDFVPYRETDVIHPNVIPWQEIAIKSSICSYD